MLSAVRHLSSASIKCWEYLYGSGATGCSRGIQLHGATRLHPTVHRKKKKRTMFYLSFALRVQRAGLKRCGSDHGSQNSAVGIVTGYGIVIVAVRVPIGSRIFSSSRSPDLLCSPPSLFSSGYRRLFPRGKEVGAGS
jgi:hypothetical protein